MFADYRVAQILNHICVLTYSPHLCTLLESEVDLPSGSFEEICIRVASILAVEAIRDHITPNRTEESGSEINSVLIDFWLWDTAKMIEEGHTTIDGITTKEILPHHRTRSIWY